MLRDDNVLVGGAASGPLMQLWLYSWDLISAVGIPIAALLLIGLTRWLPTTRTLLPELRDRRLAGGWRALVSPATLFVAALSVHALMILTAHVHFERHLLVFLPVACIAAAQALYGLCSRQGAPTPAFATAVVALLSYQIYDGRYIEEVFSTDVRAQLATWAAQQEAQHHRVVTYSSYSYVRGAEYHRDEDPLLLDKDASYIVTCDFEYARFLNQKSRNEIFHAGSQRVVDFWRAAFAGTSDFHIIRQFSSAPHGLEMRLIEADVMAPLGTFVPRSCYALARAGIQPAVLPRPPALPTGSQGGW
jgi:hypothetical protein